MGEALSDLRLFKILTKCEASHVAGLYAHGCKFSHNDVARVYYRVEDLIDRIAAMVEFLESLRRRRDSRRQN